MPRGRKRGGGIRLNRSPSHRGHLLNQASVPCFLFLQTHATIQDEESSSKLFFLCNLNSRKISSGALPLPHIKSKVTITMTGANGRLPMPNAWPVNQRKPSPGIHTGKNFAPKQPILRTIFLELLANTTLVMKPTLILRNHLDTMFIASQSNGHASNLKKENLMKKK